MNMDDTTHKTKEWLAAKVFIHTSHYDALIADYFSKKLDIKYPKTLTLTYEKNRIYVMVKILTSTLLFIHP